MKMSKVILGALVSMLTFPNLAKADFDYSALKTMFGEARRVGNCTIVFKEGNQSRDGFQHDDMAGTLRVWKDENGARFLTTFDLPKNEVPMLHTASPIAPKAKILYRVGALGLPQIAKNSVSPTRLEAFTYGADEFTYLTRELIEMRFDKDGSPIAFSASQEAGVFVPMTSYARLSSRPSDQVYCQ